LFTELSQDVQGSNEELCRVACVIEVDGKQVEDYAIVRQALERADLQVSRPAHYTRPFNYEGWHLCVADYCRQVLGGGGEHSPNVRMPHKHYMIRMEYEFLIADHAHTWR
jgi:hypothetical protein